MKLVPLTLALTLAAAPVWAQTVTVAPGPPLPGAPIPPPLPVPPVQRAPAPPPTEGLTPQEIADQNVVLTALADINRSGPAALEPHLVALRQVLDHAPARFPRWELRGEVGIVRADGQQFSALSLLAMLQAAKERHPAHVVRELNTYPLAALMMASWCNEQKRSEEAIRWADIGLAIQEDEQQLRAERGFALNQLHRPGEALANYELALKDAGLGNDTKAILLRGKGFSLIELKRLDEAEAAYNESLKLAPNHPNAKNELAYIAQQRAKMAASTPPAN